MINVYQKGDLRRIGGKFTDSAGTAADPTAVSLKYIRPSGIIVTLVYGIDVAVIRESVGIYYVDIDLTESGTWYYRLAGTGVVQEAENGQFSVESNGL